jgi:hypothetical protein
MGTLPPAISGFSPEKLPFGRMVQLSISAPTIGGITNEGTDYTGSGIYGPCPIGSIPLLIDTFIPGTGENQGYAGSSGTEANQPWQFHPQDPDVQPYMVDPNTAPWNGTRRIQFWDTVQYDYTTNNSLTSLSGTGPRLLNDLSDGQIVITAPEDRPVPYVAWLNLSVGVYWDEYPSDEESGFGFYTNETPSFHNMCGPTIGLVRHTNPGDSVQYRLLACEEVNNMFIGDLLTSEVFKLGGDAFASHYDVAFQNWHLHTYGKKFVSMFAFDVVPPNESYVIYAGWQHPAKNDWIISSFARDYIFAAGGIGTWEYTALPPTASDPDGTRWDAPFNRFGVMTF